MTGSREPKGRPLADRTKAFAVRVCRFVRGMPFSEPALTVNRQLVRAATGMGANYRAARCARSGREFVARVGVVIEEADEAVYWLEVLDACSPERLEEIGGLLQEARELLAIFRASIKTAKYTVARQAQRPRDQ